MSREGDEATGMLENHMENAIEGEDHMIGESNVSVGNLVMENGLCDGNTFTSDTYDQLVQMVLELNFQNAYLKSQFEGFKHGDSYQQKAIQQDFGVAEELHKRIESMNRELLEERQTCAAAEEALKHLRVEYSEADAKAQEFSSKLAEAQQRMNQEIKQRDEKYSELDSKFNRLHKRAKQRIQEVQKEKDDLEALFHDLKEKADQASSQASTLQQELERTRQQANEALKAMDVERQQLRSANNQLRDNIEELRHSLEPKESALEALQQSLLGKEKMLEDMQALLKAADEKRQASIAEVSSKYEKQIESLEAQLADALSDRNKATETISFLQKLVAEKESKIAEMDAASSGEIARFRAAMESIKGELLHVKNEHEKEKKSWEVASQALNSKLEITESNFIRAEIEAAKTRSQLELDLSVQTRLLNVRDAELAAAREEIKRLEGEFASYKVRAHALLQKKDAEVAAAKDNEQLRVQEEALKETEKELFVVSAERDRALQDLKDALKNHDKELSTRDAALSIAEQQIKSLETKLDSVLSSHQSEKGVWEINLRNMEETWQLRYDALKTQNEVSSGQYIQKELDDLKLLYKKLKEEHDSFRDLADKMIGDKDEEISRLLDENNNLQQSLESRPKADYNDSYSQGFLKQDDGLNSSALAAEQQILILARQQAQREEELAQSQRHILALQEEIEELERENRLHSQQEAMLKEEFRNMERTKKREGVDLTYLKNVILKLLETGEVEALLPVVAMLLQFSPEEMQKCQQAYRTSSDVPPSAANDASGSGLSLFSRFSFS